MFSSTISLIPRAANSGVRPSFSPKFRVTAAAAAAVTRNFGEKLGLTPEFAALGISEMVDENMANAARVHVIESGKNVGDRTLVAFGGAAPLHAARIAEKLGLERVLI